MEYNLTYKVHDDNNGYTILNNDKDWMVQTINDFIPFKRDTMAKSAEAHIDDILKNINKKNTLEEEMELLKLKLEMFELTQGGL